MKRNWFPVPPRESKRQQGLYSTPHQCLYLTLAHGKTCSPHLVLSLSGRQTTGNNQEIISLQTLLSVILSVSVVIVRICCRENGKCTKQSTSGNLFCPSRSVSHALRTVFRTIIWDDEERSSDYVTNEQLPFSPRCVAYKQLSVCLFALLRGMRNRCTHHRKAILSLLLKNVLRRSQTEIDDRSLPLLPLPC